MGMTVAHLHVAMTFRCLKFHPDLQSCLAISSPSPREQPVMRADVLSIVNYSKTKRKDRPKVWKKGQVKGRLEVEDSSSRTPVFYLA